MSSSNIPTLPPIGHNNNSGSKPGSRTARRPPSIGKNTQPTAAAAAAAATAAVPRTTRTSSRRVQQLDHQKPHLHPPAGIVPLGQKRTPSNSARISTPRTSSNLSLNRGPKKLSTIAPSARTTGVVAPSSVVASIQRAVDVATKLPDEKQAEIARAVRPIVAQLSAESIIESSAAGAPPSAGGSSSAGVSTSVGLAVPASSPVSPRVPSETGSSLGSRAVSFKPGGTKGAGAVAVAGSATSSQESAGQFDPFISKLAVETHLSARSGAAGARLTVPAALMFVDISGYSKMVNELTGRGESAFSIAHAVNSYFENILSICVGKMKGQVISFAGDAVTLAWPASQSRSLDAACTRAAMAAVQLQHKVGTHAVPGYNFTLRLHIAVSCGDVHSTVFYTSRSIINASATHCLSGPAVIEMSDLVDLAASGEIAATADVMRRLDKQRRKILKAAEDKNSKNNNQNNNENGDIPLSPASPAVGSGSSPSSPHQQSRVIDLRVVAECLCPDEPLSSVWKLQDVVVVRPMKKRSRSTLTSEDSNSSSAFYTASLTGSSFYDSGMLLSAGSTIFGESHASLDLNHSELDSELSRKSSDASSDDGSSSLTTKVNKKKNNSKISDSQFGTQELSSDADNSDSDQQSNAAAGDGDDEDEEEEDEDFDDDALADTDGSARNATQLFVPPPIINRIKAGSSFEDLSEMRFVAPMFISRRTARDFGATAGDGGGGDEHEDPAMQFTAQLFDSTWCREVAQTVDSHGGVLVQVLDNDKSLHCVVVFGLGSANHRAASSALAAARHLNARLPGLCNIGVAVGPCFSGLTGSQQHGCRFDLTGSALVRAARLMGIAMSRNLPCLVDGDFAEALGDRSALSQLPFDPILLKGSTEKVFLYAPSPFTTEVLDLLAPAPAGSPAVNSKAIKRLQHFVSHHLEPLHKLQRESEEGGGPEVSDQQPRLQARRLMSSCIIVHGAAGSGKQTVIVTAFAIAMERAAGCTDALEQGRADKLNTATTASHGELAVRKICIDFHPSGSSTVSPSAAVAPHLGLGVAHAVLQWTDVSPEMRRVATSICHGVEQGHVLRAQQLCLQLFRLLVQDGYKLVVILRNAPYADDASKHLLRMQQQASAVYDGPVRGHIFFALTITPNLRGSWKEVARVLQVLGTAGTYKSMHRKSIAGGADHHHQNQSHSNLITVGVNQLTNGEMAALVQDVLGFPAHKNFLPLMQEKSGGNARAAATLLNLMKHRKDAFENVFLKVDARGAFISSGCLPVFDKVRWASAAPAATSRATAMMDLLQQEKPRVALLLKVIAMGTCHRLDGIAHGCVIDVACAMRRVSRGPESTAETLADLELLTALQLIRAEPIERGGSAGPPTCGTGAACVLPKKKKASGGAAAEKAATIENAFAAVSTTPTSAGGFGGGQKLNSTQRSATMYCVANPAMLEVLLDMPPHLQKRLALTCAEFFENTRPCPVFERLIPAFFSLKAGLRQQAFDAALDATESLDRLIASVGRETIRSDSESYIVPVVLAYYRILSRITSDLLAGAPDETARAEVEAKLGSKLREYSVMMMARAQFDQKLVEDVLRPLSLWQPPLCLGPLGQHIANIRNVLASAAFRDDQWHQQQYQHKKDGGGDEDELARELNRLRMFCFFVTFALNFTIDLIGKVNKTLPVEEMKEEVLRPFVELVGTLLERIGVDSEEVQRRETEEEECFVSDSPAGASSPVIPGPGSGMAQSSGFLVGDRASTNTFASADSCPEKESCCGFWTEVAARALSWLRSDAFCNFVSTVETTLGGKGALCIRPPVPKTPVVNDKVMRKVLKECFGALCSVRSMTMEELMEAHRDQTTGGDEPALTPAQLDLLAHAREECRDDFAKKHALMRSMVSLTKLEIGVVFRDLSVGVLAQKLLRAGTEDINAFGSCLFIALAMEFPMPQKIFPLLMKYTKLKLQVPPSQ